jgi:hypothetical protein
LILCVDKVFDRCATHSAEPAGKKKGFVNTRCTYPKLEKESIKEKACRDLRGHEADAHHRGSVALRSPVLICSLCACADVWNCVREAGFGRAAALHAAAHRLHVCVLVAPQLRADGHHEEPLQATGSYRQGGVPARQSAGGCMLAGGDRAAARARHCH